jgi:hypothetical protein
MKVSTWRQKREDYLLLPAKQKIVPAGLLAALPMKIPHRGGEPQLPEPGKQYVATLYATVKMPINIDNPASYQIKKGLVTSKTRISVKEAASGGFALSLVEATAADKKAVKKWK